MTRPALLFAVTAALVTAVHLAVDPATEPFFYNDETRHVMTGVFVRDALADLPTSAADPKGYAVRYFAQYPALGLVTWPPFFYAVEGAAMSVAGTSYPVARAVVGLFALFGGWSLFRLVARTHGPWPAAVAVAVTGFAPLVFEYGRRVMLEVPTLALVLAAVSHFERYLDDGRRRDAPLACVFAALAALTRFDGVVLLPYFLIRLAARRRWAALLDRPVAAGVGLAVALTAPYYAFTWAVYRAGVAKTAGEGTRPEDTAFLDPRNLSFYPGWLPDQVGWPAVVAAGVGFVVAAVNRGRPVGPFVGLLAATYLTFTPLAELDSRHAIYWVPGVAGLAAEAVARVATWAGWRAAVAATVAVVGGTAWDAVSRPGWWVAGYGDAARYAVTRTAGDRPVLVDGTLTGAFVYQIRRADPDRRLWVLRADKLLYSMFSDPRSAYQEYAGTEAEVLTLLDRYDPELILIEYPQVDFDLPGPRLLRAALRNNPGRFRLERDEPVRSNQTARFGRTRLEVYRKLDRNPAPDRAVSIPVFGLGGRVTHDR